MGVDAVEAEWLGGDVGRAGCGGDEAWAVGDREVQAGEVDMGTKDDVLGPGLVLCSDGAGEAAARRRDYHYLLQNETHSIHKYIYMLDSQTA